MKNLQRVVVSTCGTSVLTNRTNGVHQGPDKEMRELLVKVANLKHDELEASDAERLKLYLDEKEGYIKDLDWQEIRMLSAELNGIFALYKDKPNSGDQHILLHTDTFLGGAVAEILKNWLQAHKVYASLQTFHDLSTRNSTDFQLAMVEVVKWCQETFPEYQKKKWEVVFNLTGGFKSVNGFLQTVGMFFADRVVYLFESGKDLITIPRLPMQLSADTVFRDNLEAFRQMACYGEIANDSKTSTIPETMLLPIYDRIALSPWGELLWIEAKKTLYNQSLLPLLSEKIKKGGQFEASVKGLAPDRIYQLNQQLDYLAEYLESNREKCPKSLSFKQLKGPARANFTHEFYAWSDQDAKRVYGHFEGAVFVLDELGKHL